ncbi:MAG: hypothetical protein ACK4S0_01635 [Sediminibacterium sp.]
MKLFLIFLMILSCSQINTENSKDPITIRITKKFPVLNNLGQVDSYFTQDAYVHFKEDLRIYETPYFFDSSNNNTLTAPEIRYKVFIHHKDSIYGRVFDAQNNLYNLIILKDSFTSITSFSDLKLNELFANENLLMLSSEKDLNQGLYKETYSIKSHEDSTKTGLVIYYYNSKLNSIDFTLSKELDSIHKMKLYEVMVQTNPQILKENGMKIDTLRVTNKFELISQYNFERINEFIVKYLEKAKNSFQ